ncbi:hypothetical protein FSP39_009274 [Pinctada imbricata]|uniref:Uncharacterized protein n=1 Tax=Pinctada imbricata TaxID=66713 RepID=A0AA88XCR3_PINIB|nr:hypothetical protein FSP39_009274 [Pinctada imbricata]
MPVVEADPFRGNHRLKWSKTARSLPEPTSARRVLISREKTFLSVDELDDLPLNIPYRLPRIDTPREMKRPDMFKMEHDQQLWSRYGFEENIKIPGDLVPTVRMLNPPQTYAQAERQLNLAVPKFKNAQITPTVRPIHWTTPAKDFDDVQFYKNMITNPRSKAPAPAEVEAVRPEPSPSPISRCESPAKSVKSIHWMLGSTKHPLFDNKGRSRNQGPFSREFTVTCVAPTNWMRMKWGRSRTTVH